MKIKVISKKEIFKYSCFAMAVILLLSAVGTAVAFGVKNRRSSLEIAKLQAALDREIAIYNEKVSEFEKLNSEKSSEAESYANELNEHKNTIVELNNEIDELNKQLSAKKETTTKKEPKPVEPAPYPSHGKTVYLTFDDGPSPYTEEILNVLDSYGVKATFFVINGKYNHLMKEIVNRGHAIGLHAYEHKYDKIYTSDEAYFEDLQKISDVVKNTTGVETKIMRFPGGGSNTVSKKYSKGIMTRLAKAVGEKGYVYFDWNCSNGDADGANTTVKQLNYCSVFPRGASNIIVLMHDSKKTTMESLPKIIEYYQKCGMTFGVLTTSIPPVHHNITN